MLCPGPQLVRSLDFGCIWSTPSNVQFLIRKNIIVSSNIILANIKKNLFTF